MEYNLVLENGFEYIEEGEGPTLLLLHGLFGALSNWNEVLRECSKEYRVLIPLIPIYKPTKVEASVNALADFVGRFAEFKNLKDTVVVGNSLGGHLALIFALEHQDRLKALVLTGSSGLFESGMGSTFPKRGDYQYVKDRVGYTFYSPGTTTRELVDEVFGIINDTGKALRIIKIARDAQSSNMRKEIGRIKIPTLLIWGLNDNITPPHVAYEFQSLLPNSELRFIDKCSHAAMMEQPKEFIRLMKQFLGKIIVNKEKTTA
jgi:pimeloyl-ACP methyl ester carboxylesterase